MSGAISATATPPQTQRAIVRTVQSERLFYVVAGSVMLIATVVGFRAFLAHGKAFGGGEITRQIVPLVVIHGLAMFSWVCLFLVQSVFILNGNRRLHMRTGVGDRRSPNVRRPWLCRGRRSGQELYVTSTHKGLTRSAVWNVQQHTKHLMRLQQSKRCG